MGEFYDGYKHLSDGSYDHQQIQAGVSRLERFGNFSTYIELARSSGLGSTIDDILKQPTRVVFTVLDYDKTRSDYQKAYYEILNKK